ncbi:3,4-dihydroxy-2-butanone-4-phosphate synthase [Haloarcula japonica]|uniref:3,4-dihydroxy-2-butanone 4-phosphate synthase n=1 Tax=Haloarcula japonica (strain ATCC 49778 / DSM 6131 / JCM 7785 / NBRC 101032 / NCIMB 13157 / TR-1) TaxID=1227453 RepID=M0L1P4_HALJT|nr:3,4-dihydroxy-2-butanone 4-phosphate synthase [Haloarcula japonica DSM 6131]
MWSDSMLPESRSYRQNKPAGGLDNAIAAFQQGEPVLIHDASDRENEVDLVYPAHTVTSSDVARLRNDAGGLICVALSYDVAEAFDLPFAADELSHPAGSETGIEYDDRSSFSLTVNHRDTFTGIVDNDRAQTISVLGEAARNPDDVDFASEFDIPGHVHLLKAAPNLLDDRQGHTELGIALAEMADVPPAAVVCEMLDDETGGALSRTNAAAYAGENDFVLLDESTIIDEVMRE